MKVALLSFHNAYNYGAALQAYALQCAVQTLGVECEYINYQNDYRRHAYDMKYQFFKALSQKDIKGSLKAFIGMPVMKSRVKGFETFYTAHLKTTPEIYTSSVEAEKIGDMYDKYIVGSDQVWNNTNNGGDTAFLLDFVKNDNKKISYSSSFGVSELSLEISVKYADFLRKFYRLSSRELIGTEIIEKIAGRKAHLVLDPVFLVGREEWDKIRQNSIGLHKQYIFFYTNRQSQLQDFLNTGYATNEEYHVLSTHLSPKELLNPKIKTRVSISPETFLDEIACADLVVTASFHCLALSIVYHKQFVVILTGDHGKDERITNLLKITGLENRILTSNTDKDSIKEIIDYSEVDKKLNIFLEDSREYLRRAIFDEPDIGFERSLQSIMFCQDSRCTGCGSCAAACPRHAIAMFRNEEGFLIPKINEDLCIHCAKCHSVCQVYSKREKIVNQSFYAVKNQDEIRKISSSGGVFRALAENIFSKNGIVCAAGMDEKFRVYHMIAENAKELQPMCGTYYVQSDLKDSYIKIEESLRLGREVLFVGTACQVAGLKIFLGKNYDNLVMCDILCHGAPSPMVFESFIEYLKTKGAVSDFKFRDKRLGWKGYHVSAVIGGKYVKDKLWLQSFNNLFSHNMVNRLACGDCLYANYNRPGDLTIGDFWGIEKYYPEVYDKLGVSLVLSNNEKGERTIQEIGGRVTCIRVEKNKTIQNSLQKSANVSPYRLQVFQTIRKNGYPQAMKRFGEVNFNGRVKNVLRKVKNNK